MKYYIHDGEIKHGPFSLDELKNKIITKSTPIWYDGLDDWRDAGSVEELKPLFPPTPPDFRKPNSSSKSKGRVGRLIFATLILIMFFAWTTNPSADQHRAAVTTQLIEKLDRLKDDIVTKEKFWTVVKEVAFALSSGALHEQIRDRISSEDYFVCSLTKVRLKSRIVTVGIGAFGEVWLFADVLGGIGAEELID